jgi:uncharacterized membrane protein YoaK (UPF0700 family)
VVAETERRTTAVLVPAIDSSFETKLLPAVLSVVAGSVDVISFLGLGGLFAAHITGNLAILAAHIATGGNAPLAHILSVPVFVVVLGLTRLAAAGLEALKLPSLRPLLALQFVLLAIFLVLGVMLDSPLDAGAPKAVIAGMMGVSAMAVQNALVQVSLRGAPSTAVMTTNITRFVVDAGTVLFGHDPREIASARHRAKYSWHSIIGFAAGCALGAICQTAFGMWSLVLPLAAAVLALMLCVRVGAALSLSPAQNSIA